MNGRYVYKFSNDGFDFYMGPDMLMVKVSNEVPGGRSDAVIAKHCENAENDPDVWEYFS